MNLKKVMSLMLCGLLVLSVPADMISASSIGVGAIMEDDGEVDIATEDDEADAEEAVEANAEEIVEVDDEENDGGVGNAEETLGVDDEENDSNAESAEENLLEEYDVTEDIEESVEVGDDAEVSSEDVVKSAPLTTNRMRTADIAIDATNFPDDGFRKHVESWVIDKNRDKKLSVEERDAIVSMSVPSMTDGDYVENLKGIEFFNNLRSLYCDRGGLTSLDVSKNPNLEYLNCDRNQLTSLDVSKNPNLEYLNCDRNQLTSLDVSGNPKLRSLYCNNNKLTNLGIGKNPNLEYLYCNLNQLTNLSTGKNPNLKYLHCDSNELTSLDVSKNTNLEWLKCAYNQLTNLDVSKNPNLGSLGCRDNQLTSLDVSGNPNLGSLGCDNNQLTNLDVSKNPNLDYLTCENNQLTSLDVSKNPKLTNLNCYNNQLTSLGVSKNPNLEYLYCADNQLTSLDVSKNPNLEQLRCGENKLTSLDVSGNPKLRSLYCNNNKLTNLGIGKNPNLEWLDCNNNKLISLDTSKSTKLVGLYCNNNELTSLYIHATYNNESSLQLNCAYNKLTSIPDLKDAGVIAYDDFSKFSFIGNYLTEDELRSKLPANLLKNTLWFNVWINEQIKNQKATKHTITFDANGGSVSANSKIVEIDKPYGSLSTPTRTGYTFLGWYTAKSGGSKITSSTIVNVSSNQTLYARWEINQYTIAFNANGGSVNTKSKTVEKGKTYGTLPTPTRAGYTFLGWYTAKSGGSKITSSTTVSVSSNQTLYAQWKSNKYKVTFNANGGSVKTKSKTVEAGKNYGTLPTPTRASHTFLGWYTAKSGGSKITTSTAVKISSNQTLYARWAKQYKVTFNANKGKVTKKSKTVVTGSTYGTMPKPTRKNYTFKGWYTAKKGGKKIEAGTQVKLTKNQTLYARWSLRTYTIKFNANKGTSGKMKNLKLTHDKTKKLTANKFKRKGYKFVGWNTKANGKGKSYKNKASIKNRSVTLYAQWKKVKK